MRRRRDPFARCTYVPKVVHVRVTCSWCGAVQAPRRPLYEIVKEDDQHDRDVTLRGVFESWSCAEAYHGERIGR